MSNQEKEDLGRFLKAVRMAQQAQEDGLTQIADQYWAEAGEVCAMEAEEELLQID